MKFNGEGIQHVALLTDDLPATIDRLQLAGLPLMTAPNDVYYDMLEERLPGHGQPVAELQTRGILLDGSTDADKRNGGQPRLLLQIFSADGAGPGVLRVHPAQGRRRLRRRQLQGPVPESLERDQIRRGALTVDGG